MNNNPSIPSRPPQHNIYANCQPTYREKYPTPNISAPSNSNNYSTLIRQCFSQVEKLSIQLLSMIEKGNRSAAKVKLSQPGSSIKEVEQQLNKKFQEIIKIFSQFQKYVDNKMRETMRRVQEKEKDKVSQNNVFEVTRTLQDNRYEFLNDKIRNLQASLSQTKQNQMKLLEIIDKLIQKHEAPDLPSHKNKSKLTTKQRSYTTLRPYVPIIQENQSEEKGEDINTHDIPDTQSIYQKLYPIQSVIYHNKKGEIQKNQNNNKEQPAGHFRLRQLSQDLQNKDQVYIRKLYSKQHLHNPLLESKKSLRTSGSTNNSLNKERINHIQTQQENDREHRLQYMIGNLKQ